MKKTTNHVQGSLYSTSHSRSSASERRPDLTTKHGLGTASPHTMISKYFYSDNGQLYITAAGLSNLAQHLNEATSDYIHKGFSYSSKNALDLSSLERGGLWNKLHGGPDPVSNPKNEYSQNHLASTLRYWLTNDQDGTAPVDEDLAAHRTKTWWKTYTGKNDSGSGSGDFALSTFYDWLFMPSKT